MRHNIVLIFRFIQPLFWIAQAWMLVILIKPRVCFESNLKLINKLLILQGFDTQLPSSDKAFKIWHRDIGILFFLNILVIILIRLI